MGFRCAILLCLFRVYGGSFIIGEITIIVAISLGCRLSNYPICIFWAIRDGSPLLNQCFLIGFGLIFT